MLCGFFSVKRKLFWLPSVLHWLWESHSTGVNPPKMFPFVSKITTKVFAWPSHRRWNSFAPKPSRLPRHRTLKLFPLNSAKVTGSSDRIRERRTPGVGATQDWEAIVVKWGWDGEFEPHHVQNLPPAWRLLKQERLSQILRGANATLLFSCRAIWRRVERPRCFKAFDLNPFSQLAIKTNLTELSWLERTETEAEEGLILQLNAPELNRMKWNGWSNSGWYRRNLWFQSQNLWIYRVLVQLRLLDDFPFADRKFLVKVSEFSLQLIAQLKEKSSG
jgi:hypothetical protein